MTISFDPANADQVAYWNGVNGRNWTDRQAEQDKLLSPATERLIAAARIGLGERVLDVGCGCGETTLLAASAAGVDGFALGVDISEPMILRARQRAIEEGTKAEFLIADATTHDFSDVRADILISRLGVMFFADPAASFSNLRRGLKPAGRVVFVCWREPKYNPWNMLPYYTIRDLVPPMPKLGPEDPGPFAFADPLRVQRILETAGFADVALQAEEIEIDVAHGRGFDAAVVTAMTIGPAARALNGQSDDVLRAAEVRIREALAPYQRDASVSLGAAIWIVTAKA